MKARNKYKLLLFADLILSWGLLDTLVVGVCHHEFYSSQCCCIYSFLAANPMEAETVFGPVCKPYIVHSYVIPESRLHVTAVLTPAPGTRGPPSFPACQNYWQAHYDEAL